MALKCGDKGFMCFGKCKDMLGLDVNYFFGNPCVESDIEIFARLFQEKHLIEFQIYSKPASPIVYLWFLNRGDFRFDYSYEKRDITYTSSFFEYIKCSVPSIRRQIAENGTIILDYRNKPITQSEAIQLSEDYHSKAQKIVSDLLPKFTYTHSKYSRKYYKLI